MTDFGSKSILLTARARVEIDDLVGGMLGLLGRGEKLCCKKLEMVTNWQYVRLRMKVVN